MPNLFTNEFQPSSSAAWKQKIQFELDGADYNQTLLTKTNEGITIKPFYHTDNFEKVAVPETKNTFNICKTILITTEETANIAALSAIENGANALKFNALKPFDFSKLLQNLLHKNIDFHFSFGFLSETFTNTLCEFLTTETAYLNIDIIGTLAKTGNWFTNLNADFKNIENIIQTNPSATILSVNAGLYQNAGANNVQQVAYALAHANEYFNKFGGKIADKMQFNFATGSHYFFEIAKIRAFRYLLNLVLAAYQTSVDAQIFSEPSFRNKTIYNSNLNLLRASSEIESAILGSANTVANSTFNLINTTENEIFDLKNPQQITTDCYYIEAITKQIAEQALIIFKEIEKSGGFLRQLKEGTIQRKIVENAKKEQDQFNSGELILLGVNKYKNEDEKIKHLFTESPFVERKARKTLIIPIIPKRLAEKMEQKRWNNEA